MLYREILAVRSAIHSEQTACTAGVFKYHSWWYVHKVKVKVNQSCYRPEVAQRVPES